MGEWDDDPELQRSSAEAEAARLYQETRGVLLRLFTRKFGIAADEAEKLVYETFFSYLVDGPQRDAKAWLIGAACSKAVRHLRWRGVEVTDAAADRVASGLEETRRYRQALEMLPPRAREAFRLYWDEGMTYAEIGAVMGIPEFAAKRLVMRAWGKVRNWMRDG